MYQTLEMPKRNNKKGSKKGKVSVPRGMTSVTPLRRRLCTLVFASQVSMTESAAGTGAYNFYRLNGPYDPDTAVLSAATPGLAALSQLYRSMRVLSAGIEVAGSWLAQNFSGTALLSVVPTAFQPVLPSNPSYWPVQPNAASVPTQFHSATSGTGFYVAGTFPRLSKNWTIHDIMNVTRAQYVDEADYASLTNSNPTRQAYVAVAITTNCATTVTAYLQVKMKYVIEFFDPYPLQ